MNCESSALHGSKQNHLERVCICKGVAHSSHAHPCLWQVTQADAMPVICKDGPAPALLGRVGGGCGSSLAIQALLSPLAVSPSLGFNLREGSF